VFIAGCVFSIAVTLRGYPLMGGGHYGVDHRASPSPASAGDVALAVLAALVPVVAWLALGAWRRRQMEATSASTSIASCSRWSGATRGGRNRSTLP